jgi:hypothetical protein
MSFTPYTAVDSRLPAVVREQRDMVVGQRVLHLGNDGKLPVVQHLGQVGTGLLMAVFCQNNVKCILSNLDAF